MHPRLEVQLPAADPAGRLRFGQQPLLALEILLDLPGLRDVLGLQDDLQGLAVVVAHERARDQHPHQAPVRATMAPAHGVVAELPAGEPVQSRRATGEVEGTQRRGAAAGEQRRRVVADELAQGLVDPQPAPVTRDHRDTLGRGLEQPTEIDLLCRLRIHAVMHYGR